MMPNQMVTPRRIGSKRRGVSLIEVLISTFVLSIGLLGIASLIPVGQRAFSEATRLDRASHIGRAALRDVKVRRMIDFSTWSAQPSGDSDNLARVIDPLGMAQGQLGGLPRVKVNTVPDSVFRSTDDLLFNNPLDKSGRPTSIGAGVSAGDYSWLCTVVPSLGEAGLSSAYPAVPWPRKTQFEVSVAVVYRRGFQGNDSNKVPFEQQVTGKFQAVTGGQGGGFGGGSFLPDAPVTVKENTWVLAVGTNQVRWYRVVAGAGAFANTITLTGPDWNSTMSPNVTLVVIKGVIGVYSQTMEIDRDPLWSL